MCRASSLHVSPRGEVKCVREPSGRGASRPRQQRGPLAFHETRDTNHGLQGFSLKTNHYPLLLRFSRNTRHETRVTAFMLFTKHETRLLRFPWPSDISSGANQAATQGFHESRNTRHESRPFFRVLRPSGGEKCSLVRRSATPKRSAGEDPNEQDTQGLTAVSDEELQLSLVLR